MQNTKKGNYAYEKETTCTMDFYWIGIRYCGRHVVDGPAGHCGNLHQAFGTLFLNLLKFIVVPIVLFSIMNGVISMKDIKKVGSIGGKTVIYYMCTTFFAVTMGLLIANLFKKGFPVLSTSSLEYTAAETPSFIQTLIGISQAISYSPWPRHPCFR